jgi:serine/threonine-protein kinase RsbT
VSATTLFHLRLNDESDVPLACQRAREAGRGLGLTATEIEALATAVSEIARNVVVHAVRGEVRLEVAGGEERPALVITIRDDGPGIAHIDRAMQDGYSTGPGLGLGLPGARSLVDELDISSRPGVGTTVTLKKWLPTSRR